MVLERAMRLACALAGVLVMTSACTTSSPPALEPQTIPEAEVGRYYEVFFTTSGGATVSSINVPQGLELVTGLGHGFLFGVPANVGQHTFRLTAGSGGPTMFTKPGFTEREYTLTVGPAAGSSGLLLDGAFGSFTQNVPIAVDLSEGVRGGQTPYRFAPYCVDEGKICDDAQTNGRLPDGVSLSADGVLSGAVPPKSGVSANPHDRRIRFIACVVDGVAAHACATVELYELDPRGPSPDIASPAPSAT